MSRTRRGYAVDRTSGRVRLFLLAREGCIPSEATDPDCHRHDADGCAWLALELHTRAEALRLCQLLLSATRFMED